MFEKFDRKFARGCLAVFAGVVVFCAVGGFNLWRYAFLDEPMIEAVRNCDYESVKGWLNRWADPNAAFDGGSDTALYYAKQCKDKQIAELLRSRGARD